MPLSIGERVEVVWAHVSLLVSAQSAPLKVGLLLARPNSTANVGSGGAFGLRAYTQSLFMITSGPVRGC